MTEIEQIHLLAANNKIRMTDHALKRAMERGINIKTDIVNALINGDIIEEYPNDYPFKSYLIYGTTLNHHVLHIVCAIGDEELWIISEYFPNNKEWEKDLRTRRKI